MILFLAVGERWMGMPAAMRVGLCVCESVCECVCVCMVEGKTEGMVMSMGMGVGRRLWLLRGERG